MIERSLKTNHVSFDYQTLDQTSTEPSFLTLPIYYKLLSSTISFWNLTKDHFGSQTCDQTLMFQLFNFRASVISCQTLCLSNPSLQLLNHWLKVSQKLKLHLPWPAPPCFVCQSPKQTLVVVLYTSTHHSFLHLSILIMLFGCFLLSLESLWCCLIKTNFNKWHWG